jgi:hypothetical protein
VYVQAFPKAANKTRISTNGGDFPVWRPDGRAVFFITASGELVEAELSTVTAGFEVRAVRTLFHPPPLNETLYRTPYAITEDGQRFLMNVVVPDDSPKAITVILNWKTGLK